MHSLSLYKFLLNIWSVVEGDGEVELYVKSFGFLVEYSFLLLLKWKFKSSISPLSAAIVGRTGAFVGGATISIFGFCSSNRQWSKHWSTTMSISSSSGHSRLGHGDHHSYNRNNLHNQIISNRRSQLSFFLKQLINGS